MKPLLAEWDWQLDARCRGLATDMFFSSEHDAGAQHAEREETAKGICRACTVRRRCLRHALSFGETHGIWGATTPRERRQLTGDR